jgi:hypothetical protein
LAEEELMSLAGKPSNLTFEDALQTFGAKQAFNRLVNEKVDPELLKHWLRDIANAPEKYGKRTENKRKASQLAQNARSLATKIDRSAASPPMSFMGAATDLFVMLELQRRLPKSLREYAACWEKRIDWEEQRPHGPQNPKTDRIWALLEIVKKCTGSYHYPEVADLLNVMDMACDQGNSGTHWDERNLGQLQHRARKRLAKILKD